MANQADPGTTMGSAAPDSAEVQAAGESAPATAMPDQAYDVGELTPGALLPSQMGGY